MGVGIRGSSVVMMRSGKVDGEVRRTCERKKQGRVRETPPLPKTPPPARDSREKNGSAGDFSSVNGSFFKSPHPFFPLPPLPPLPMLSVSLGAAWVRACVCVCNTQAEFEASTERKLTRTLRKLLHENKDEEEDKGKAMTTSTIEPTAIVFYIVQTNELHGVFGVEANGVKLERRFYCSPVRGELLQPVWPRISSLVSHVMTIAEMRQVLALFHTRKLASRALSPLESLPLPTKMYTLKTPLRIIHDDGEKEENKPQVTSPPHPPHSLSSLFPDNDSAIHTCAEPIGMESYRCATIARRKP
jgi:hypothetical protein